VCARARVCGGRREVGVGVGVGMGVGVKRYGSVWRRVYYTHIYMHYI